MHFYDENTDRVQLFCPNLCSLLLVSFIFYFCYRVLKRGCLTCIRWFCPFMLPTIFPVHIRCCYGYNLDRSVCLSCYELEQFSDLVVLKAGSIQKCFFHFFLKKVYFNFFATKFQQKYMMCKLEKMHKECVSCIQICTKFICNYAK